MAKLAYINAAGQRLEIDLGPHQPVVLVGRLAECQIQTTDTSVSRRHSQFTWKPGDAVEIQDLNSSNGTFVNDQRITTAQLGPTDRVRCGNFQVEYIAAAAGQPPRMPGPPMAGDPTRFGPGASGMGGPGGGPGGGQGSTPYLDDPSLAMTPEAVNQAYAHIETHDQQRGGLPPAASYPPPPGPSAGPSYSGGGGELDRALRRADALAREVDELRYESQRLRSSGGGGSHEDREAHRRLEAENRRLREENERLYEERKEMDRAKAQMDALSDRNVELKEQFAALQEQQAELRDKLREAREDLDNALFKRDELSTDVERLEGDKTELFDQLTKLKIEYNHLERASETTRKDHGLLEFEYKRLDETNQELERELRSALEGENEQSDSLNRLQTIVDEKENLVADLKEQIEELKVELRESENQDSTWMVEVEQLKKENEELLGENEELLEKIDELREVISAQRATTSTESEGLQEELVNLKEENRRLHSRLTSYVSEDAYKKIEDDNDDLRIKVKKLEGELDAAKGSSPSGAEELLTQIRELTSENHRLEAELRKKSITEDTSPGTVKAVNPGKAGEVFKDVNSMVSGWRANLETMQIHVGDLSDLMKLIQGLPVGDEAKDSLKAAINDADPDWACESMGETVKQILTDSKKIKGLLLELREELGA